MNANTTALYVNPFHVVNCFTAMLILNVDFKSFAIDILRNDWKTLSLFIFMGF